MTKRVLTIKEAAQLIDGITEYRIRQLCISGQLPCFKAGKKYLISEDKLYEVIFGNSVSENTSGGDVVA
ncbi:MAG: helix-turn-helix domain-containing protein [Ruminiclostridium sp.]|nr:helix-turn-helix domain-containing protein [Ruminiclostridium sp.]